MERRRSFVNNFPFTQRYGSSLHPLLHAHQVHAGNAVEHAGDDAALDVSVLRVHGAGGGVAKIGAGRSHGRFVLRRPEVSWRCPEAMGRQGRGAPPVALHLGHGQAPLKKKRAGARPKRAAAGVPLRESLAVFRWGCLQIVKSQCSPRSLPSCRARGKENPLSRTSTPRSFRKGWPFGWRKGRRLAGPPSPIPAISRKSYAAPHVPRVARRTAAARARHDRCPLPAVLQIRCTFFVVEILSPKSNLSK